MREVCPEFPGGPERIHWSIADPALEGDTDDESYPAFQRTAAEIENRVQFMLHVIRQQHSKEVIPMTEDTVKRPLHRQRRPGAVDFYTKHFGFTVGMNAPPAIADGDARSDAACCCPGRRLRAPAPPRTI